MVSRPLVLTVDFFPGSHPFVLSEVISLSFAKEVFHWVTSQLIVPPRYRRQLIAAELTDGDLVLQESLKLSLRKDSMLGSDWSDQAAGQETGSSGSSPALVERKWIRGVGPRPV